MPGFRYQAYNVDGKLHKGVLEADSARQARATLRDQGLTPYRVDVIAANDPAAGARFRPVALSASELTQLTRGLASLLEAGLTVEQAFNALIEQAENERVRQVLAALRGEVLAGNTVAKALATFPAVFSELYRTLVAAQRRQHLAHALVLGLLDQRVEGLLDGEPGLEQRGEAARELGELGRRQPHGPEARAARRIVGGDDLDLVRREALVAQQRARLPRAIGLEDSLVELSLDGVRLVFESRQLFAPLLG